MQKESESLVGLIQSLLVYSDLVLDDSPIEKIPADLCRLIHEVTGEIQKHLDSREISLSVNCPDDSATTPSINVASASSSVRCSTMPSMPLPTGKAFR